MLLLIALLATACLAENLPTYDPEYGVYIGDLSNLADGDIHGKVYVVNETAIQLINFTYSGKASDVYFWLDRTETPTKDGLKIPTFEFGITPLGKYEKPDRVLLVLPGLHKITSFKSFSIYSLGHDHNFGSIIIPDGLQVPKPQFLSTELKGSRYSVGSGPILVMDRRTIKIFGFTFDGDKAPDGYFFVGRGPNVAADAGVKVPIRGRDTPQMYVFNYNFDKLLWECDKNSYVNVYKQKYGLEPTEQKKGNQTSALFMHYYGNQKFIKEIVKRA